MNEISQAIMAIGIRGVGRLTRLGGRMIGLDRTGRLLLSLIVIVAILAVVSWRRNHR